MRSSDSEIFPEQVSYRTKAPPEDVVHHGGSGEYPDDEPTEVEGERSSALEPVGEVPGDASPPARHHIPRIVLDS